jgi:hypothetical protein
VNNRNFKQPEPLCFDAFGVKIGIRSGLENFLPEISGRLKQILPNGFEFIKADEVEHFFNIKIGKNGDFLILKDDEIVTNCKDKESLFNYTESQIRLTVAEFAVGKVFIHAGVIGWKGKAVIIPASSFAGKSTLVAELIKNGAVYYSDEYAVLDKDGLVYPFPKMLSLRGIIDDYQQLDCSAESLGGETGKLPIPVGIVLICRFDVNENQMKRIKPEILSPGQGFLEILAHTIPIRFNPKFSLEVLKNISTHAIIAKIKRGEAKAFVTPLLQYLDAEL